LQTAQEQYSDLQALMQKELSIAAVTEACILNTDGVILATLPGFDDISASEALTLPSLFSDVKRAKPQGVTLAGKYRIMSVRNNTILGSFGNSYFAAMKVRDMVVVGVAYGDDPLLYVEKVAGDIGQS